MKFEEIQEIATGFKLSKRALDAAKPDDRAFMLWDSEVSGFGLKVHPTGRKIYVFKYRVGGGRSGRRREPIIGVHDTLTPDQARQLLLRWLET